MDDIKRAVGNWKDKLTKTGLERRLIEATSNDGWGVQLTLLQNISESTHSASPDRQLVMKYVTSGLKAPPKEWKRLYKVLCLVEHLLKFGSQPCVQEIREESSRFHQLQTFSYSDKNAEHGQGVRDKATYIVRLLDDFRQLEAERDNARRLAGRYVGISAEDYRNGGGAGLYQSVGLQGKGGVSSTDWKDATPAFEPPKPTESTLFQQLPRPTPGPEATRPRPAPPTYIQPPQHPESLFTAPEAPKPQVLDLFTMPKPAEVQKAPAPQHSTDLFTALTAKPKPPLFTMPQPQAKPAPPVFSLPKAEVKPPAPVQQAPAHQASPLEGLFFSAPSVPAPEPQVPKQPAAKIHHNMEVVGGPTIQQLKTTPSLAGRSEKAEEKKEVDLEAFLCDLGNIRVEASRSKPDHTHLRGFGVST